MNCCKSQNFIVYDGVFGCYCQVLYEELTDYQKSLVDKLEAEKESQRLAEETAKRKKLAATTGPVDLDSMKVAELKAMCKERVSTARWVGRCGVVLNAD